MSTEYRVIIKVEKGLVGHAFLTLVSPNGPPITVGFYPVQSSVEAPGIVKNDAISGAGNGEHLFNFSKSFTVSAGQYQAMLTRAAFVANNPGEYGLLGNQCTEFVQDVLNAGGITPSFPGNLTGVGSHPTMLIPAFSLTPENQVQPFRGGADNADSFTETQKRGQVFHYHIPVSTQKRGQVFHYHIPAKITVGKPGSGSQGQVFHYHIPS